MSHNHHPAHGHHESQHESQHGGQHRPGGLPDLLDLDAEVLAGPLGTVRADLERLADAPVLSILDVGAGTGTGTVGLLTHFPQARVTALDADEEMLARLREHAADLGLTDRVSIRRVDLDDALPELAPVDLAWASASMHHLTDPDRTLTRLLAAVRPGGLLAVLELTGHPRFVPDDAPGGTAEARAHALLAADRAADLPAMGSDWASRLAQAGWVVELARDVAVDVEADPTGPGGQYAAAALTQIRDAVADRLDPAELAAYDALLDGGAADVRRRGDLRVQTTRHLVVARRPQVSAEPG